MAETIKPREERLKYLDFVQVGIAQALMFLSSIYGLAKENSGPLRPGVQSVERTVKSVVGPVLDIFHDAPSEVLKFVDRKVDGAVRAVEKHVPEAVHRACAAAKTVAGEVQRSGVVATAGGIVKEVYGRYEPVAEKQAVAAWRALNRMPVFPQIAQFLVPTATYSAEKYNQTVRYVAAQGWGAASYLPIVPIERIRKVFAGDAGDREVVVEKEARGAAVSDGEEEEEEEAPVAARDGVRPAEKEAPVAAGSE